MRVGYTFICTHAHTFMHTRTHTHKHVRLIRSQRFSRVPALLVKYSQFLTTEALLVCPWGISHRQARYLANHAWMSLKMEAIRQAGCMMAEGGDAGNGLGGPGGEERRRASSSFLTVCPFMLVQLLLRFELLT